MARIKKRYIALGTFSLLIFVALFFLSTFTKNYLTQNQGIPAESVIVSTDDLKNLPDELKIPQFKIEGSVK